MRVFESVSVDGLSESVEELSVSVEELSVSISLSYRWCVLVVCTRFSVMCEST